MPESVRQKSILIAQLSKASTVSIFEDRGFYISKDPCPSVLVNRREEDLPIYFLPVYSKAAAQRSQRIPQGASRLSQIINIYQFHQDDDPIPAGFIEDLVEIDIQENSPLTIFELSEPIQIPLIPHQSTRNGQIENYFFAGATRNRTVSIQQLYIRLAELYP